MSRWLRWVLTAPALAMDQVAECAVRWLVRNGPKAVPIDDLDDLPVAALWVVRYEFFRNGGLQVYLHPFEDTRTAERYRDLCAAHGVEARVSVTLTPEGIGVVGAAYFDPFMEQPGTDFCRTHTPARTLWLAHAEALRARRLHNAVHSSVRWRERA